MHLDPKTAGAQRKTGGSTAPTSSMAGGLKSTGEKTGAASRDSKKPIREWVNPETHLGNKPSSPRPETSSAPLLDLESAFPEVPWSRIAGHPAFQKLLRSDNQLASLMGRWPGVVFSQKPDFTFVSVSPKIEKLTGISLRELKSTPKSILRAIHEADLELFLDRLRKLPESNEPITSVYRIRHVETGRVAYIAERRQCILGSGGLLGYEGFWLDITRQTLAERRLMDTAWKENLCTITMGLTHDFCNLMTGIVSLSESYESSLEEDNPLREGLKLIRSSASQGGQLAHRVRQLHQGQPGEKNYHDLNEIVSSIAEILQKVLSKRVKIQTALQAGQLPVYLDSIELQQVVVNLALNAVDAMPNGGQITIRTARHDAVPTPRHFHGTMPRLPLISLSVQDTGEGIPARLLDSVFDAFFTTKPFGKGSGLGLYNTRVFAEKHHSAVSVESTEGTGTTFHLWFAQSDFTEAAPASQQASVARQTLMVVGSAGATLNTLVETLRKNGYYVAPATSDAEALETLRSPDFNFSGVLLLFNGAQKANHHFARRLRSSKTPLKTICVVSGNQDEVETSFFVQSDAVLAADMPVQDFLARLRAALNPC